MPDPTSIPGGADKTRVIDQTDGFPEGTRLNDTYIIDGKIALGGMAEVYRGRNIHTEEPVAIKIVLPEFSRESTIVALFRKEATVLNRLSHEAIVRYLAFTIEPTLKRPYMVMEFVDGISLLERLQTRKLDADETRTVIWRVASGLAAAHQAGVIHRDLSPDNVILPGGEPARAKVIDFGIAKSTTGEPTLLGGKFAGKYNFVSPEQLGLYGAEVTERSDIYGLGLIAAAANLGRPLDMSGSHIEVIDKRRAVPDLSEVDESLRPIIAHMLEPDPANRPESMNAVLEELIASGMPSKSPAGSWPGTPPTYRSRTPGSGTAATDNATIIAPPPGTGSQAPVSESPFGPGPKEGSWQAPGTPPERQKGGKGLLFAGLAVLVLGGAGGGAYFGGLLTPYLPGGAPDVAARIAALPAQECLHAMAMPPAANGRVTVQLTSARADAMAAVARQFQDDANVVVAQNLVEAAQCPVVNLLSASAPAGDALQLSTDALISNDIMDGTLTKPAGTQGRLYIIDNTGTAYDIAGLLRDSGAGASTFRMRLQSPSPAPVPQLVLAVFSAEPLAAIETPAGGADFAAALSAAMEGSETPVTLESAYFRILPE